MQQREVDEINCFKKSKVIFGRRERKKRAVFNTKTPKPLGTLRQTLGKT